MQPGTAGLTLTSDTDIDSLASRVLALDTQNSATEMRCGSTLIHCIIYSETPCIRCFSLSEYVVVYLLIYTMYSKYQIPMKVWLSVLLGSSTLNISSVL